MILNDKLKNQLLSDIEECKRAIERRESKNVYEKMKARYTLLDKSFINSIPAYAHAIGSKDYNQEVNAICTVLETYIICGCIPVEEAQTEHERKNQPIIFLSHCSKNKNYADILRDFIVGLGVRNNQLIYTSHPLHKIPLDKNIYDYLRSQFDNKILVIELLSDEYFESAACLNEMGAAWVTKSDYTNVFVPDFNFNNQKYLNCATDIAKMGMILKPDEKLKASLIEFKDKIINFFNIDTDEIAVQYLINRFIESIENISKK